MGACECDNPMEFGYEVNSIENENESNKDAKKKFISKLNYEKNINNKEKINLNYQNYSQNNSDNFISIENERNPKEIKPEQNTEEKEIKINPQNKEEGVNALKSRFEINEEITNDIYLNGNNNNDNNSSKFYFTTTAETPKGKSPILYRNNRASKKKHNIRPKRYLYIQEYCKGGSV